MTDYRRMERQLSENLRLEHRPIAISFRETPRPTCMALPAAFAQGMVASTGCIGNRVYTTLTTVTCMLRLRDGT